MSPVDPTPENTQGTRYKVAIVDANKSRFQSLTTLLESQNLSITFIPGSSHDTTFVDTLAELAPDIILINLFLDGKSTLASIRKIKSRLAKSKIIVLTAHNSINNIRESVKAGADDFVLDPFEPQLMLDRIRYQLQERELFSPDTFESNAETSGDSAQANVNVIYETLRILSEVTTHHEAITSVLEVIASNANSNRVNLLEGDLETNKGMVAATSDDASLEDLPIDLEKYPEVREVLLNGNIIYIKDITQNPLTKDIQDQVKSIKITSLLVFPIRHRSNTLGSLNIRLAGGEGISERQLKTFFIIALALGPKVAAKKLLRKHKFALENKKNEEEAKTEPTIPEASSDATSDASAESTLDSLLSPSESGTEPDILASTNPDENDSDLASIEDLLKSVEDENS